MKLTLQPVRRNPRARPTPPNLCRVVLGSGSKLFGFSSSDCKSAAPVSPFRMNTCKSVSKQRTLTTFRMNTCEKQGGGGTYLRNSHDPVLAQGVAARELLQVAEPFHAPARQKWKEAQLPRLQLLIGKQEILQEALMFRQQPAFLVQ